MYRQNEEDAPKDSDQARTCECRIIWSTSTNAKCN
jgi:hypothetical protein